MPYPPRSSWPCASPRAGWGLANPLAPGTDFQHFFWELIRDSIGSVLLPLNRDAFPRTVVQVAGFALAAAFFVSLLLWGRAAGRSWASAPPGSWPFSCPP